MEIIPQDFRAQVCWHRFQNSLGLTLFSLETRCVYYFRTLAEINFRRMNYSILLVVFGLSMAIVEAKMCFGSSCLIAFVFENKFCFLSDKTNGGVGEVYCKSKFCMK